MCAEWRNSVQDNGFHIEAGVDTHVSWSVPCYGLYGYVRPASPMDYQSYLAIWLVAEAHHYLCPRCLGAPSCR